MTTLLTLPPHLLETIQELLAADIDLPQDLRDDLLSATQSSGSLHQPAQNALGSDTAEGNGDTKSGQASSAVISHDEQEEAQQAFVMTVDLDVVDRLARWASSERGIRGLIYSNLDPSRYLTVSLLAGTEVYVTPAELERIRAAEVPDKYDPYLPSYLSTPPASIGKELRGLGRQLTTVFNVLFSIFGSGAAVYVASVTGAGYSKETAILLAILTGVVVGVADSVLVWIFIDRIGKEREERKVTSRKMAKGSGALLDHQGRVLVATAGEDDEVNPKADGATQEGDEKSLVVQQITEEVRHDSDTITITTTATEQRSIRLRRKPLSER